MSTASRRPGGSSREDPDVARRGAHVVQRPAPHPRRARAPAPTGYLLKHAEPEEILDAIRAVVAGGPPLDPKAARVLLTSRRRDPPARAADRPRARGARLVARRATPTSRSPAGSGISERTVKAHLTNVFQRLGVTDRTQAALWAERAPHLVSPCR